MIEGSEGGWWRCKLPWSSIICRLKGHAKLWPSRHEIFGLGKENTCDITISNGGASVVENHAVTIGCRNIFPATI